MCSAAGGRIRTSTRPASTATRARARAQPGSASRAPARGSAPAASASAPGLRCRAGEHLRVADREQLKADEPDEQHDRQKREHLDRRLAALTPHDPRPRDELAVTLNGALPPPRTAGTRTDTRTPPWPSRSTRSPRSSESGSALLAAALALRPTLSARAAARAACAHSQRVCPASASCQASAAASQHQWHCRHELHRSLAALVFHDSGQRRGGRVTPQ